MRVAIYARFSSDLQDARSIGDQVAAARAYATREGWLVVAEYSDAAISGATLHNRPGLLDMMVAANARAFEIVLTESLDRLSRDLEDIAGLHKRLAFLGIRIVTLADGKIEKLHVGLKGLIASLYLDDLAQKTRRGQMGRARSGRIPGGRSYGYDVATDGGERGRRTINGAEAAIVRRIFAEYLAGRSPLAIVSDLNREGVPGPRGGPWSSSTLNGSRKRGNGILSNALYVGRIEFNRQRFIKDPATGRRQARPNPAGEWLIVDAPELAIVDPETWAAVRAIREARGGERPEHNRRPRHLFSGVVRCGACGAAYIVRTRDYLGCSAQSNSGTCGNVRKVATAEIEGRALDALRRYLLAPDAVAEAVASYRDERRRLAKDARARQREAARSLTAIEHKIGNLVAAIEQGGEVGPLTARLADLERERRQLEAEIKSAAADAVVELHPEAATRYRQIVQDLHASLTGDGRDAEAVALVRGLVQEIRVLPTPKGQPVGLEIVGDLAGLMRQEQPGNAGTATMVAGARSTNAALRSKSTKA